MVTCWRRCGPERGPRAPDIAPWMAARAPHPVSASSDPIDKGIERRSRVRGPIWPQTDGLAQQGQDHGTQRGVFARPGPRPVSRAVGSLVSAVGPGAGIRGQGADRLSTGSNRRLRLRQLRQDLRKPTLRWDGGMPCIKRRDPCKAGPRSPRQTPLRRRIRREAAILRRSGLRRSTQRSYNRPRLP